MLVITYLPSKIPIRSYRVRKKKVSLVISSITTLAMLLYYIFENQENGSKFGIEKIIRGTIVSQSYLRAR